MSIAMKIAQASRVQFFFSSERASRPKSGNKGFFAQSDAHIIKADISLKYKSELPNLRVFDHTNHGAKAKSGFTRLFERNPLSLIFVVTMVTLSAIGAEKLSIWS